MKAFNETIDNDVKGTITLKDVNKDDPEEPMTVEDDHTVDVDVTIVPIIEKSSIKKTGTEKITDIDKNIDYKVDYKATIKDFQGDAVLEIVDNLPYEIDVQNSRIGENGEYDKDKKTITWREEIKDIDTFRDDADKQINVVKELSLKYIYNDNLKDVKETIDNKVTGKLTLQTPDPEDPEKTVTVKEDTKEDDHKVKMDITARVIVKHVEDGTNRELAEQEEMKGHVDDPYTTSEKEFKYYNLVKEKYPSNSKGKMAVKITKDKDGNITIEDTIYVIYFYKPKTFNLKVDKEIASLIVNGKEEKIDKKLTKKEIRGREIDSTDLKVRYRITVTNDGEIEGSATVKESIPTGLKMNSSDNKGWKKNGNVATIKTDKIAPGKSKKYTITLTWEKSKSNFGLRENKVELTDLQNPASFAETNKEDNKSSAELILSVATGGTVLKAVIMIVATLFVIFGVGVEIMNTKLRNRSVNSNNSKS